MTNWRMRAVCLGAAAAVLLGVVAAAIAATSPAAPTSDPFYAYSGSLANIAPGTVLRTRQIHVSVSGVSTPYTATQALYRSTTQLGQPEVTVTTIIKPPTAALTSTKILSYQIAYDCDTATGRPSYQLEGGTPGSQYVTLEAGPMLTYLAQGYTVVTSDYEGPQDEWGAGRESGYATLDGILAAEHVLGVAPSSTPAAMVGYSGGSIATMWALNEQPTYAPSLDLFGASAAGIPVDYTNLINYVNGTGAADVLPSVLLSLFKAYNVDYGQYLNANGIKVMQQASQLCLSTSFGNFKLQSILQPQYQDWEKIPVLANILNNSIMSPPANPKVPLMLAAGNADGTGDGLMVAKDAQELAYEYCQRGDSVQYSVYPGLQHVEATETADLAAHLFLAEAQAGKAADQCSSITPGNPLTPLPVAAQTTVSTPRAVVHVLGVRGSRPGLVVGVSATGGTLSGVTAVLQRSGRTVARASAKRVAARQVRLVLRVRGRAPAPGRYTLQVRSGGHVAARRTVVVSGAASS